MRLSSLVNILLTGFLILPVFYCSKKTEVNVKDRFPLIANAEELTAATDKAGSKMVVVDLYADWCMPCKLLEPTLQELAKEFRKTTVFYRVDVDKSRQLAASFGVRGIPHVLFFKGGKNVYSLTGLNPKETYAKVLGACDDTASAESCINQLNEIMR